MRKIHRDMDMLQGALPGKLLLFTLPIALSSMMQQLFNAADTFVVGRFDSEAALAAVGINTEIVALVVTLSVGLSLGANILAAGCIGKRETGALPAVARTALFLALTVGLCGLGIGQWAAMPLLRLIRTPESVLPGALTYLRLYFCGYPFLLLYDFGAAILRAKGDSRHPFFILALSGVLNVLLNLLFVLVFHAGVAGVAIATDISTAFSALLVLVRLYRDPAFHFSLRLPFKASWGYVRKILRTGVPSAVQGAVVCFANIFVQTSINTFGPTAVAGSTIAMNFEYFAYYGITAFGQTATTFISQNYSAGQRDRCRKILCLCLLFSALCSAVLIYPIVLFRGFFAGLFSPEAPVVESASVRILCILLFEPLYNLCEIPAGALRGAGHATLSAVATMVGICLFRIVWIFTVFHANPSLPVLFYAFPLSWGVTILLVWLGFFVVRPFRERPSAKNTAA